MSVKKTVVLALFVTSVTGCGGGNAPAPVTEQQMTAANAKNARENVRGLVQTVREMLKTGDDVESLRDEIMPTFANYAANTEDPHHAIYKRMRNAWEDIGGDSTNEALKELEAAYKELP